MKKSLLCRKDVLMQVGFLVMLFLYSATAQAQDSLTGTVSDENGPIPGVTIILKVPVKVLQPTLMAATP